MGGLTGLLSRIRSISNITDTDKRGKSWKTQNRLNCEIFEKSQKLILNSQQSEAFKSSQKLF